MGGMSRKRDPGSVPRPRKYKVARGAAAEICRECGISESHVSRVINGRRTGGPTLTKALERAERQYAVSARMP